MHTSACVVNVKPRMSDCDSKNVYTLTEYTIQEEAVLPHAQLLYTTLRTHTQP